MSETKSYKGVLKRVSCYSDEVQEFLKMEYSVYLDKVLTNAEAYEFLQEFCYDQWGYCDYFLIKDILYKMEHKESLDFEDILVANYRAGGEVEFLVQYHSGGCSFEDAVKEAVSNI